MAAELLPAARVTLVAAFVALAVLAIVRMRRTGRAGWWVAAAFSAIAVAVLLVSDVSPLPELPAAVETAGVALLLLGPYLLLRFTAVFQPLPRWLEVSAAIAVVAVVVATVTTPELPDDALPRPAWVGLYLLGVAAYWAAVSLVTVVRLWQAGRRQPLATRRRMRLMSLATGALTVALLVAAGLPEAGSGVQLLVQLIALASVVAFGLGLHPPRVLRLSWRSGDQRRLQQGTMAVLRATTTQQVAEELLPPTIRVVGGSGAALVGGDGTVVASHGQAPAPGSVLDWAVRATDRPAEAVEVVRLEGGQGALVVFTSAYTPFFGQDEIDLLHTMGAVASLALERVRLLEEERHQRQVLDQARRDAEDARDEAARANTAKSEFLSRMSHELRTPLNAILGFGQLLESPDVDADEHADWVGHILKAGHHLLALINDVLDLSRIEAGVMTISPEAVHTGELIGDAIGLIRPTAEGRSIRLSSDLDGCDVFVTTDRQRCRQVLLNLLSNAVKYNHDDGTVHVTCAPTSNGFLQIAVTDSGPGIDPARHQQLFQPFERLGAEATGVEGTGLGLALSKQLVERMGGTLGFDSTPGQGSTFWIDLPVVDAPSGAVAVDRDRDDAPSQPGGLTLLLIEDNLANLRVVEAMLRRRGNTTVLPAMQGRLGIDLARQHRPDVIVLDLHLPDLPGREVLHRLKADARTRDIPVIVASADASPGRIQQLETEGAFDYITKPLDLKRFLAAVDAATQPSGDDPQLDTAVAPEAPPDDR